MNEEIVIKGILDKYIYIANDSLYKVARIDTKKGEVIIVGEFQPIEENREMEFKGYWKENDKYGQQLYITSITPVKEMTAMGLITYLSSGEFKGVGQKTAARIVKTLGRKTIEKILLNPDCLLEVEGLKKEKREIIYQTLKRNEEQQQAYVELFELGLSNKMVARMIEKYGLEAGKIIKKDPYRLIHDVEGFGFKKTDIIALNLGIEPTSMVRLTEAVMHTLTAVCYQQGFTYLYKNQLINSTELLLKQTDAPVELPYIVQALDELIERKRIIFENERVYEPGLYNDEINVAKIITKMSEIPTKEYSETTIIERLKDVEEALNITYTPNQYRTIQSVMNHNLNIITGGPGTGKTTIIKGILYLMSALMKLDPLSDEFQNKVVLMAPTGRAAKRMSESTNFKASTIHKTLGYNHEGEFTFDKDNKLSGSLFIIDEASMVDLPLAHSLFQALPLRAKVILVGDENQLPSVGPGSVLHDLIASDVFNTLRLTQIMRQAEQSNIIKLAQEVLSEKINFKIFNEKKEVYFYPCDTKSCCRMLEQFLTAFIAKGGDFKSQMQILIPMYAGLAGIDAVNQMVQEKFINTDELVQTEYKLFKKGDKVLQLQNDSKLEIMNGDIGIVLEIIKEKGETKLLIDFDGRVVTYGPKLDNLTLAYAISVHKSQGSEYDNVIIPILPSYSIMLRKKIIYTAVTRTKKKLIILGDYNSIDQAIRSKDDVRLTSLSERFIKKVIEEKVIYINDPQSAFSTLGEYDMDGISPKSFM